MPFGASLPLYIGRDYHMKTFTLNGTEYKALEFDFNLICDLEDMGITMESMQSKAMNFIRSYISLCIGKGREYAGQEINAHIIGGGSLDEIMGVIGDVMGESDFFRALSKDEEEETPKSASKAKTKTTK